MDMRPIHELDQQYDGGKFSRRQNSYYKSELEDPVGMAERIAVLLPSQDPEDRRDADRLAHLLTRAIYCPDGVWVVETEYLPDASGKRWSDNIVTWSAHLSKKQAEDWWKFWKKHWDKKGRNDYGMLPIRQANNVPLHELVHPDAKVGQGVNP